MTSKQKGFQKYLRTPPNSSQAPNTGSVATTMPPADRRVHSDSLAKRLEASADIFAQNGGLSLYTESAAKAAGLSTQIFQTADLFVHPYNPRPVSAEEDLNDLTMSWAASGQQDPIHVVMWNGKPAIMEGQRRWLVAKATSTPTLFGYLHPTPADPLDIYLFGYVLHKTRKETTAIDSAMAWIRMIEEKVTDQRRIAERCGIDESLISKTLAIFKAGPSVISEIRKAPSKFTSRHLHALAVIWNRAGEEAVIDAAHRVVVASVDDPVTARDLERLAKRLDSNTEDPTKKTRRRSTVLTLRDESGKKEIGQLQCWESGKLTFTPPVGLTPVRAEQLVNEVRTALERFLRGDAD